MTTFNEDCIQDCLVCFFSDYFDATSIVCHLMYLVTCRAFFYVAITGCKTAGTNRHDYVSVWRIC